MAFELVPKESKNMINKAGQALLTGDKNSSEYQNALDLANRWRACHAYPINTFQANLRTKLRTNKNAIVAQRLKRMPTIIDKLSRYPNMKLSTMQDIGGIRAILNTVSEVNLIAKYYRDNKYLEHRLVDEKNYILNPRDEDGYRSIHFIYKYKNTQNPNYDGLRLELQFRTKLQHLWATSVETMGTFLGQALKSRQGEKKWLDFFALISTYFAYEENTQVVPRFSSLTGDSLRDEIIKLEKVTSALAVMQGMSAAANFITSKNQKDSHYYLIILDSTKRRASVKGFSRNSIEIATKEYAQVEKQVIEGRPIEPVLVSVGSLENVKKAYPNFFLNISKFAKLIEKIVKKNNA